jgi:hypothetical protein
VKLLSKVIALDIAEYAAHGLSQLPKPGEPLAKKLAMEGQCSGSHL